MSPVTEEARLHLYEKLQQQLGDEHAVTLMTMLPPSGFDELATKTDLHRLEERLGLSLDGSIARALEKQTRFLATLVVAMMTLIVSAVSFAIAALA